MYEKTIRYVSTFSGIGGFEIGIRRSVERPSQRSKTGNKNGQPLEHAQNIGRRIKQAACVGFSEIDKYATQIYRRHFPDHPELGDITKINTKDLPDFDLLVGGFPCQAFSIAGKRMGFKDTRGTMFFELARILADKQPRLFLFENVKGLLSHDEGRTIRTIFSAIDELGYDADWQVLNSKDFGVPQNRERIFIAGHLRGTPAPQVFPLRESGGGVDGAPSEAQGDGQRVRSDDTPIAATLAQRDYKGGNNLIDEHSEIRRLTPLECERLQGFDDGWTQYGLTESGETVEISDTQRYKTLGNAVTTYPVQAVCERLLH
jgi:site-specific DNA-cytosine methylase